MCGVLGIAIKNFNGKDYDLVRSLFIQSMIRGKHATGASYVKNNKVITVKEPIPAEKFISNQDLSQWTNEDGNLYCIGHARYSTSDLRYNQPMATEKLSIVHNGVISQEAFSSWFDTYGLETETENDSELILRCIEHTQNPLTKFTPASMAVCTVSNNKVLTAFRNEARPLYCYNDDSKVIFSSTSDILKRAGCGSSFKVPMYETFLVDEFKITSYTTPTNNEDLQ